MANRSYLYSINETPGQTMDQTLKLRGLSEYPDRIPLSFLLLVSSNTKVVDSLIWDLESPGALVGDYNVGVKNLIKLIELLKDSGVDKSEEFKRQVEEMKNFIENKNNMQDFIILEFAEIYLLSVNEDDAQIIKNETEKIVKAIENKDLEPINSFVMGDVTSNWNELLGINHWSDILYYHFEKPFKYSK